MIDLACSLVVLALVALVAASYRVRRARRGVVRFDRVDRDGGSPLLSARPMHVGYWALQPAARACAVVGVSANTITAMSAVAGVAAGVSAAAGHLGVAALLAASASVGDALDGLVARQAGTATASGALFDAAADRYQELSLLAGIAYGFRASPAVLGLALLAIAGAFMVSYASAKAEALGVVAPRGAMRRAERAVYLDAGLALTPLTSALGLRLGASEAFANLPIVLAVALVAIVGNISAVKRLRAIGSAADRKTSVASAPAGAVSPAE
jgi:CDP-diacylglycerol--glycerol-3-phosphate 3-phosphatidyltransferase